MHYQPIVDLTHRTIRGYEALLRWTHPTRRPLPRRRLLGRGRRDLIAARQVGANYRMLSSLAITVGTATPAGASIGVVKNEHIGQAFGAIRKAGTVVVVGVSNEREGAPFPGFNAITVAMFQKRIEGSLYGMGSPRDAMPNLLLNLYVAGRLKLDELITRRYALDDVNQVYADMRSGVNIRGVVDFIPAG